VHGLAGSVEGSVVEKERVMEDQHAVVGSGRPD